MTNINIFIQSGPYDLPEGVGLFNAPKAGLELVLSDPAAIGKCRADPEIQRAVREGRLSSLAVVVEPLEKS